MAKIISLTREQMLETVFCDIPATIGTLQLRALSAGSFTLLGRLGNPMIIAPAAGREITQTETFAAVIQYVWVHSADLAIVAAVRTEDDLPAAEIAALGFGITIGQAFGFLNTFTGCASRMSASLAEVEEEETVGKPSAPASPPVGSPASSSASAPPVTPCASATSSGSCPSSAPLAICTPPTSPMEPAADGPLPSLTILPDL